MTYLSTRSSDRRLDNHFIIRFIAAILAAHLVVSYNENETFFELLALPEYYPAFFGSFLIALGLIELVFRASDYLHRRVALETHILTYGVLQLTTIFVPVCLLAYFFALIYFWAMGVHILDTSYLSNDYRYIVSNVALLNSLYFIAFLYIRMKRTSPEYPVAGAGRQTEDVPGTIEKKSESERYFEVSKGLRVPVGEIAYAITNGKVTQVYPHDGGQPYICYFPLKNILEELGEGFFQVRRELVISRTSIMNHRVLDVRKVELDIWPPQHSPVIVSQRHYAGFMHWFDE